MAERARAVAQNPVPGMTRFGLVLLVGMVAAIPAIGGMGTLSAMASAPCSTTTTSNYSIQVCLTQPADGSVLAGNVTVAATVTVLSGRAPITDVIFSLGGQYQLADFQPPWGFVLPTTRTIDGSYSLSVYAEIGSAKAKTSAASVGVRLQNGITHIPPNTNPPNITPGTAPAPGQPAVVAVVGDGASGVSSSDSVVNLIKSWNPNLFLYLGDVYRQGAVSEFTNWYDPSWGQLRAITDPVIGNHEYGTPGGAPYFDYWNNLPSYYSFNSNGWHFIALNANPAQYFRTQLQQQQLTWLQSDLTANAGSCIVAYYHQPLYTVGSSTAGGNQVQPLWQALANAHASLVLNGHDHTYQRWQALDASGNLSPTGVTEMVNGTGGHEIATITKSDSRVANSLGGNKATGALKLSMYPSSISYQFVQTSTGQPFDQGSVPCQNAPSVTGVSPTSGRAAGGTAVTINGSHLSSTSSVSFGGVAASAFSVVSDSQVTATSPPGSGTVDITVTTRGGTTPTSAADQFTYIPAPAVTGVSPSSGPATGGTSVTINGTNFTGTSAVAFGGVAASTFTVVSDSQVTATSPAGSGTVDITITTPSGVSATGAPDQFTYLPAPSVVGLSPNTGPAAGGTSVTVTGSNFTGVTGVTFGTRQAASFTIVSDTQIVTTTPPGRGLVNAQLTSPGGKSAKTSATHYTYT